VNSDELVQLVRVTGQIPRSDPTYTSAQLRTEIQNTLTTLFERPIVNTREGYWLKRYEVTTTGGKSAYRLPHRAIVNMAERVEISTDGQRFFQINKLRPRDASAYDGSEGTPNAYTLRGDVIQLLPTPSAGIKLRVHYYLRPSILVAPQPGPSGEDPVDIQKNRGLVTDIPDATTLYVAALPWDMVAGPPLETGQRIDVVRPNGSHEVVVVSALCSVDGDNTLTFEDEPVDLSLVEPGDYVRVEDQSEWPPLPQDFHRTLAEATAAVVLISKGYGEKAQLLAAKVKSDMERFEDLLQPRVKDSPAVAVPRYGMLRSRRFSPMRRL
jgi:hypothetical protein